MCEAKPPASDVAGFCHRNDSKTAAQNLDAPRRFETVHAASAAGQHKLIMSGQLFGFSRGGVGEVTTGRC